MGMTAELSCGELKSHKNGGTESHMWGSYNRSDASFTAAGAADAADGL